MCKIGTFQRNFSTIFLKLLNIYLFSKIFQKVEIVMLRWNILQYLRKMLRQYFSCNERLEIFLTCFCNIIYYVGGYSPGVIKNSNMHAYCIVMVIASAETFSLGDHFTESFLYRMFISLKRYFIAWSFYRRGLMSLYCTTVWTNY